MFIKNILVKIYNRLYDYKILFADFLTKRRMGVPKILTINETIDYIIDHNCSVCRYGDGELKLISGERIYFQEYNEELSLRLAEILKSYTENCLVCLPDMFEKTTRFLQPHRDYIERIIAFHRLDWYRAINMNEMYGNAFISRGYQIWKDKSHSKVWFDNLKRLWYGRDIVFIEGEKSRLGYGNDLFSNARSIERILCPQMNAFSSYENILFEAKKIRKNKLIIIALGPTATILAYDLSKLGYQALDLGHIDIEYEWLLRGATEKVKIEGKFISEAPGGTEVEEVTDLTYQNQIIKRIAGD